MKSCLLVGLTFLLASHAIADVGQKIKFKDIKTHLATANKDATCMDEYVKRRKELIIRLVATPVALVGTVAASAVAGVVTSEAIAFVTPSQPIDDIGYIGLGLLFGGVAGLPLSVADTTLAAMKLGKIDLILKTLGEQHLNLGTRNTDKLYSKYLKKSKQPLLRNDFIKELMKLDASGELCDGSMKKKPLIKLSFFKMQYKVAELKEIIRKVDHKEAVKF